MRTRSQARRRRQPQVRQTSVESSNLEKPDNPPIVTMADNRTMAQLLEAPTEGYEMRWMPHHGFSELQQLDTFYNALNSNDQDSLNSAAGGKLLKQNGPRECLKLSRANTKTWFRRINFSIERTKPQLPPRKAFEQSLLRPFQQANSGYRPPMSQIKFDLRFSSSSESSCK
ncbi:hypothetical protein Tco_1476966 [Tanacetum coccineum]